MENAKKMLLIEPEMLEKLKKDNANTSVDNLSNLDNEMRKVLNTKLEDREKWSLYLQILQRYLYFIDKDRKPVEIPIINIKKPENIKEDIKLEQETENKDNSTKAHVENINDSLNNRSNIDYYTKSYLLQLLPKTYKAKGELLIDLLLKNKDTIYWNDQGTVFINNKELHKSNIVDLLNDVIRPLKHSSPRGWVEFSSILKELKVPVTYIGNPKRATFINLMSKTPDFSNRVERSESQRSAPDFSTPYSTQTINKEKPKRKLDWERWTPYKK